MHNINLNSTCRRVYRSLQRLTICWMLDLQRAYIICIKYRQYNSCVTYAVCSAWNIYNMYKKVVPRPKMWKMDSSPFIWVLNCQYIFDKLLTTFLFFLCFYLLIILRSCMHFIWFYSNKWINFSVLFYEDWSI
jgi:hypothetical protein